jgi:hypothetical protein
MHETHILSSLNLFLLLGLSTRLSLGLPLLDDWSRLGLFRIAIIVLRFLVLLILAFL